MAKISKPLAGVVIALNVAAVAMVSVGIDQTLDEMWCLMLALLMEIVLFTSFVLCLLFCNDERTCEVRCIRVFVILQILIMVFLIICLRRAGGSPI